MRLILAAAVLAALPATAHEYRAGTLTVDHPVIYEGPPTMKSAAGYMTIRNDGEEADMLVGVSAAGPDASLHETRESDGVMRMSPVDMIEIPAGGSVSFEPGGLHVMFMGVSGADLREGATLSATLEFETAGEVEVTFNVEARGAADHTGHATH